MHSEVEFSVSAKAARGKGAARKTRAAGLVPGIVYGFNMSPTMVSFEERELVKALSTPAGRNVFLRLKSEDKDLDGSRALVKELQVHPLRRKFVHADFFKLDPDRPIHATVPVKLVGTAAGVKLGGIMQVALREMPVLCKPDDLPEAIVVDVTEIKLGHSIHVGEIAKLEGVEYLANPKMAICAVISPSEDDTAKPEAGK